MLFRDTVDLLEFKEGVNENGFPTQVESSRETVFANKKSIRGNEFYLAAQNGFQLELMFEIRSVEYNGQKYLEFEGKKYEIVRTYDKGETIELSCQAFTDKQ